VAGARLRVLLYDKDVLILGVASCKMLCSFKGLYYFASLHQKVMGISHYNMGSLASCGFGPTGRGG
jgi:hypothetical protein